MLLNIFKIFKESGYQLYYIGGIVRDTLLNKEPKDIDLATDALPEKIKELLTSININYYNIGEKFGTIAAIIDNSQIEITTYREDITYGRHPEVKFTNNLNLDLSRRDFTINSMAMDIDKNLIDPFNGKNDINNKIIRTTGNPNCRFNEDPLRMLRAVRFSSQLGFNIYNDTFDSMINNSFNILSVSHERWAEEMNKLLIGDNIIKSLNYWKDSGLMYYMVPILQQLSDPMGKLPSKDLWLHTIQVVNNVPKNVIIRWAALLHDIGKLITRTENGGVHFFGHENTGFEMAKSILNKFKMSNSDCKKICGLVKLHHRVDNVVSRRFTPPVSLSGLRRVIRECEQFSCDIKDLIELFDADCTSGQKNIKERQKAHAILLRDAIISIKKEELRPRLPSGIGDEIMRRYNLKPSKKVGEIKSFLDDMLLRGVISMDMSIEEMFLKLEQEKK